MAVIINSPSLCMPSSLSLAESFDIEQTGRFVVTLYEQIAADTRSTVSRTYTICANVRRVDNTGSAEGAVMENESPSTELERLRERRLVIRRNEVYGGLSKAERAEYEAVARRIDALIKAIALFDRAQAAETRVESPETDTPQNGARQPYRSREKDSTTAFVGAVKKEAVKRMRNPEN